MHILSVYNIIIYRSQKFIHDAILIVELLYDYVGSRLCIIPKVITVIIIIWSENNTVYILQRKHDNVKKSDGVSTN